MKRIIYMIVLTMLLNGFTVYAENTVFEIGTYYQMGKYNNEPILWECIDTDDENGTLLLSDKILCYKIYDMGTPNVSLFANKHNNTGVTEHQGNYLWEESALRDWLNSDTDYQNTKWHRIIPENTEFNPYNGEMGFLSDNNFTKTEKSIMKTVNQWQLLHYTETHLSENDVNYAFGCNYSPRGTFEYGNNVMPLHNGDFYDYSSEAYQHIEGAMYRSTETMFILRPKQLRNMFLNFGTLKAEPTKSAKEKLYNEIGVNVSEYPNGIEREFYWWISQPHLGENSCSYVRDDKKIWGWFAGDSALGIRPAFYVNELNAIIKSGSGTETDPYILDGKEQTDDIMVFCNNEQVEFDQQPVIENDRLLVPVRAIFEQLGASVEYDGNNQLITARNDEKIVTLQIDNPELNNGAETYTLDVAPKIIGDRTMIPLRAVSEAFGARVRYIDNLRRVSIDKPELPMDFGEGVGLENWQQDKELRERMESTNWFPYDVESKKSNPAYQRYWLQNDTLNSANSQ